MISVILICMSCVNRGGINYQPCPEQCSCSVLYSIDHYLYIVVPFSIMRLTLFFASNFVNVNLFKMAGSGQFFWRDRGMSPPPPRHLLFRESLAQLMTVLKPTSSLQFQMSYLSLQTSYLSTRSRSRCILISGSI